MCGRYTSSLPGRMAEIFETLRTDRVSPRYNIAPRRRSSGRSRQSDKATAENWRCCVLEGLIPSWGEGHKIGRASSTPGRWRRDQAVIPSCLQEKALPDSRSMVSMSGRPVPGQKDETAVPHRGVRDVPGLCLAGLREQWTDPEGKPVQTSAIIRRKRMMR